MQHAALSALLEHLRSNVNDATDVTIIWRTFTPQEQWTIIEEIETLARMAGATVKLTPYSSGKNAVHEWLLSKILAIDGSAAARLAWHILEEREFMTTKNTKGVIYVNDEMLLSWQRKQKHKDTQHGPQLTIFNSGKVTVEGKIITAVDITICGESDLLALRTAIDEALGSNILEEREL